jgi:hypothetical protein
VHGAFFEKAVAFAEAEAARVAGLPTPRHNAVEVGEDEEETPEPPPPPPLFVPANVVQWKELMASDEIQELIRSRQCRLMKVGVALHGQMVGAKYTFRVFELGIRV